MGVCAALPQALRVLDVSRRPAVTDELLHHLAAHPPASLHTLDVSLTVRGRYTRQIVSVSGCLYGGMWSLTDIVLLLLLLLLQRVTPDGLLMLLSHCSKLRVLRYACRSGDDGLDTQLTQRLAAALPAVQEMDLSLHPNLNDGCLAALAQCKTLRKVGGCSRRQLAAGRVYQLAACAVYRHVHAHVWVLRRSQAIPAPFVLPCVQVKFARSHKVTRAGFQQLQAALPMLQEFEVVRCRTAPGVSGGARKHFEGN
jgi:hypothetical protein